MINLKYSNSPYQATEGVVCNYCPNGKLNYTNPFFSKHFVTRKETGSAPHSIWTYLPDEDKHILESAHKKLNPEHPIMSCRFRLKKPMSNSGIWYNWSVTGVFDGRGNILSLSATGNYSENLNPKPIGSGASSLGIDVSDNLLAQLFHALPGTFCLVDLGNDSIIYMHNNLNSHPELGLVKGGCFSSFIHSFIDQKHQEYFRHQLRKIEVGGASKAEAIVACSGSGSKENWQKIMMTPFAYKGQVQHDLVLFFFTDVTKNMLQARSLAVANERFTLLSKAGKQAIWDWEVGSNKFWWNDVFYRMFGFGRDCQPTVKSLLGFIHPHDTERVESSFNKALAARQTSWEIEFRCRMFDGNYGHVLSRAAIIINENGETERVVGAIIDITNQKLEELALEESQVRYSMATKAGQTGVWEMSLQDNNTFVDENLISIFGYSSEEFFQKVGDWHDLIKNEDRNAHQDAIKDYLQGKSGSFEEVHRKIDKNGSERWVLSRGVVIKDEGGIPQKIVGTDTDITAYKLAEEALQDAHQQLETVVRDKERLFSMINHEIRNPMNTVIGIAHLLGATNKDENTAELINTLNFSAENLLGVVNDILDFSKIKAGKLQAVNDVFNIYNLLKSIEQSFAPLAAKKNIYLRLEICESLPKYVVGDKFRLSQILNNLLSNAIKFTQEGGVVLSVWASGGSSAQHCIKFEVRDTGIGISPEKQEVIFEPFGQAENETSAQYGGTGLGLAIVKELLQLMGGHIFLSSYENIGTSFKIDLPFEGHSGVYEEKLQETMEEIFEGIRILYVEDVLPNQVLMKGFAKKWKAELDVASNGYEAIELVKENRYDLILMDIQMPGLDGFETSKRIRGLDKGYVKEVPIIALTGEVYEDMELPLKEAGMNDYLGKPIKPSVLGKKIAFFQNLGNKGLEDKLENVDFEETDKLFADNPDTYQHFLTLSVEEIEESRRAIVQAIREWDFATFRHHRHKMNGVLVTLKLHTFAKSLEKLKGLIEENQNVVDREQTATEIDKQFMLAIQVLKEKISIIN
ncbi:PAS domain-containing protein [Flammeovirgaceae bacterium SG7u.111]|nr:PAS domain-containing protein [Flammeovirgaceae bacterium SG7u.132]WPO36764.1 PAS domain-containing protein [Flammeovirgaceae bacterium SG7u.111]